MIRKGIRIIVFENNVPQVRKCIKIHWEANLNKKLLIAKAHPTKGMIGCLNSRS